MQVCMDAVVLSPEMFLFLAIMSPSLFMTSPRFALVINPMCVPDFLISPFVSSWPRKIHDTSTKSHPVLLTSSISHTVDGCEILRQLVYGVSPSNPIIYFVSYLPIVTNQDFFHPQYQTLYTKSNY